MKAFVIKLAGVAVLIGLIVFAIVIFRHGRTSTTPESEKKQAVASVQDQAGEVESQQGEVNDPAYLAYKEKVARYREQIEQRYPNTRQSKGAVELLDRIPQRYYGSFAGPSSKVPTPPKQPLRLRRPEALLRRAEAAMILPARPLNDAVCRFCLN